MGLARAHIFRTKKFRTGKNRKKKLHEIFSSMNIDLCKPMLKCSSLNWEKAFSVLGGSTDIEIEVCIKAFFRSIFSFFFSFNFIDLWNWGARCACRSVHTIHFPSHKNSQRTSAQSWVMLIPPKVSAQMFEYDDVKASEMPVKYIQSNV